MTYQSCYCQLLELAVSSFFLSPSLSSGSVKAVVGRDSTLKNVDVLMFFWFPLATWWRLTRKKWSLHVLSVSCYMLGLIGDSKLPIFVKVTLSLTNYRCFSCMLAWLSPNMTKRYPICSLLWPKGKGVWCISSSSEQNICLGCRAGSAAAVCGAPLLKVYVQINDFSHIHTLRSHLKTLK